MKASSPSGTPLQIYQDRIKVFKDGILQLTRWDKLIAWARLVVVLFAVILFVKALSGRGGLLLLGAPMIVFISLAMIHSRVIGRREHLRAGVSLCEAGIDRIRDNWAGKGDAGEEFRAIAEGHIYAADLDLFGNGGLYELLNVARSPIGRSTLARWLQAPSGATVARERQGAVAELAPRLDLREDLALAATTLEHKVRDEALMDWAVRQPEGLPISSGLMRWRLAFAIVAVVTLATAALWFAGRVGPWPFIATLLLGCSMSWRLRRPLAQILAGVDLRADELGTLAALMARLERESFYSPALCTLRKALDSDGMPPSRRIAQLRRWVDLLEGRRNQIAWLLMATVQATAQLALMVEAWRREVGPVVLKWMTAVGELEALSSLATFRFEHPEYPFPQVLDEVGPADGIPTANGSSNALPVFHGDGLGHPLIPAAQRVVNDVNLSDGRRLMLVSGSNMSGKSTLLRTVGINAVLALIGAPVCASSLIVSPVSLGATLRINDSLQGGISRFYAELTRLKQIVDRSSSAPPMLFLLDEILHGTNSHDRRIGAEAIIQGLLKRGAVGLVTTHDLALAALAEGLGSCALNVHFEDRLEAGVMTFDYRIKMGVVRKSNALALMRAVGLEV